MEAEAWQAVGALFTSGEASPHHALFRGAMKRGSPPYRLARSACLPSTCWLCLLSPVLQVVLLRTSRPSSRLVLMVQALTSSRLASAAPAPGGSGAGTSGVDVPSTVQAHAWVALGKMCLADEALAKK